MPISPWNGRTAAELALRHPERVGQLCGFDRLRPYPHGLWLRHLLLDRQDFTLMAHRGSYKTTCLSLAMALTMILWPEKKLLFLRKTDGDVAEVLRQVKGLLASPTLGALSGAIYGAPMGLTRCNARELTLACHPGLRGAPQLVGQGIGGSLTGKHADLIFTDDIVNLSDRVSEAERTRTRLVYQELQNIRNPGGRIVNTGTPWHREDAFALMPGIHRFDCHTTGLMTPSELDSLRRGMTPSLFAANYELKHIAAEDALFAAPAGFTEDERLIRDGIAHLDASYGGGDYTALTCLRRAAQGYVLYGRLWSGHVDSHLEEIIAECRRLMCAPIYLEVNGDKGYLARTLRGRGVQVHPYTERMNKFVKISTHLYPHWGEITLLRGTDPAYLNQILDYTPHAAHDDAPDSAACALRALKGR